MIKTRIEEKANYKSVWCNSKTVRFAIDPSKPITELEWPEFFDIKLTGNCLGKCPQCYMDSKPEKHYENIVGKTRKFFNSIPKENLPYQIAYGGGEPTSHPDFLDVLKVTKEEYDVCPNYTTNGMWVDDKEKTKNLLTATKKYCGGVAVSCHPHLRQYWELASNEYVNSGIKLNFHIIISDKESIDYFREIYDEWKVKVDYFVLLPYGAQGRAVQKDINWDYLVSKLPEEQSKIAFGANFYPYLLKGGHNIKISLYEPEIMSKFITLEGTGKMYKSSFSNEVVKENLF